MSARTFLSTVKNFLFFLLLKYGFRLRQNFGRTGEPTPILEPSVQYGARVFLLQAIFKHQFKSPLAFIGFEVGFTSLGI